MSAENESNDCSKEPSQILSVPIILGKINSNNLTSNGDAAHQNSQIGDVAPNDSSQKGNYCQHAKDHSADEHEKKLNEMLESLSGKKEIHLACESFLLLAELSQCPCFVELLRKDDNFAHIMSLVAYKRSDIGTLLFCKAVFMCMLTKHRLHIIEAKNIEAVLLEFLKALTTIISETDCDIHLHTLPRHLKEKSTPLCETIASSSVDVFNINEINVTYLCLKVIQHLSSKVPEWQELDFFSSSTMFQVLEKFHACVTSPVFNTSYNLTSSDGVHDFQIAMICYCLQTFETVFFKSRQKILLNYKENFFLKCISRHLSFCIKALFPKSNCTVESADDIGFEKKPSVIPKFVHLHQSCLISILKVLLNMHPNFDNIYDTSSLMEKLLICFLETSYSSLDCKFELCLMTLELMVNLIEFELVDRKHFAKMCLMKFNIGKSTCLSVEILIKILICSLKRVLALGSLKKPEEDNQGLAASNETKEYLNSVYHVAEEHMEHSFICSYICVFLSYFCDIKEPFFIYVCERISIDMAETAIVVMGKFKEFIPLMSKQNGKAFDMLDRAIRIFLGMARNRQ